MAWAAAIQSAETVAALRALAADETSLAERCEDRLAKYFLGAKNRLLLSLPHPLVTSLVNAAAPGSYCYAIARTRCFDEALLAGVRGGIEQLVLLGAGYDSRPYRFAEALSGVRVFEVDLPGTQARKRQMIGRAVKHVPSNVTHIALDFTRQSFQAALAARGFSRAAKTLLLWEGVSYYLPRPVVEDVLDFVADCGAGSSIVFDYALKSFVDGDISTYGGTQVAKWLKRIDEPFVFGLAPEETADFVSDRHLRLVFDLGPDDVERLYLRTTDGGSLGRSLGHVRIAQAATA